LPLGLRREAGELIAFDCMLCHGGRVAGSTLLGAASTSVDLESFFDDLNTMRKLAPALGIPAPPAPFDLDSLTSAPGAHDAFGLGFRFTGPLSQGANSSFGPQKPPAWWLLKHKARIYVDRSGDASSHHSMDTDCARRRKGDARPGGVRRDVRELPWRAQRGRCRLSQPHRRAQRGRNRSRRAERFTRVEADRLNASWFGDPPFEPTGGYLAQPLAGIWARAPYLHNGSVFPSYGPAR
jgi:hypothetical protein